MNVRTLFEKRSAQADLEHFGLPPEEVLIKAVLEGHYAKGNCTKNHPPYYRALVPQSEATRALGELTLSFGWNRIDESMQALVVSPDGTKAIIVASGNEFTGFDGAQLPSTKSPKGPKTVHKVLQNVAMCGDLFMDLLPDIENIPGERRETWLLLFNPKGGVMRAELSRPGSIKKGKVDGWQQRIILTETPLGEGVDLSKTPDYAPLDDIEITEK